MPCFECMAFKAKSNNKLQKLIADRLQIEYNQATCGGCRENLGTCLLASNNKIFHHGRCKLLNEKGQCYIFLCAESKHLHNCSECVDFPCDQLQPMADKSTEIYHNLKCYNLSRIKKMGLEAWVQNEATSSWNSYMTQRLDS